MSEPTRTERLRSSRDRLASLLETADERYAPALSREYRAVLSDLAQLGEQEGPVSASDDLARKRAARRTPRQAEA